jgi:hypothetical protein
MMIMIMNDSPGELAMTLYFYILHNPLKSSLDGLGFGQSAPISIRTPAAEKLTS